MTRPDPAVEIRLTLLRVVKGANYWSRRPVVRMDLAIGAYDEISSADAPGFTERLQGALPGLIEHRCSIGERGGFITRLRQGTYAGHIVEHVALELQNMLGHDVGFGQTRGGSAPGEYTLVFEYKHSGVALRAASLALAIVQSDFAGTLVTVDCAIDELRAIAATPDALPRERHVLAGITGGSGRAETLDAMTRLGFDAKAMFDLAPASILLEGLPYSHSDLAIILDTDIHDVPARFREPENARKLVSVLCDATRDGLVIAPWDEPEIHAYARKHGCRVAVFATDANSVNTGGDVLVSARVVDGRIRVSVAGEPEIEAGALRDDGSAAAQVVAALAAATMPAGTHASMRP